MLASAILDRETYKSSTQLTSSRELRRFLFQLSRKCAEQPIEGAQASNTISACACMLYTLLTLTNSDIIHFQVL